MNIVRYCTHIVEIKCTSDVIYDEYHTSCSRVAAGIDDRADNQ